MSRKKGPLLIIGGHEEKEDGQPREILELVAEAVGGEGTLAVITVATQAPETLAERYRKAFRGLGVRHLRVIDVRTREEAYADGTVAKLDGVGTVFFSGGDQLRITSQIGDSPLDRRIREIHEAGVMLAGTSAGAAAMTETMVYAGGGDESQQISALRLAPGLGLLRGLVIDVHFAERGRMGRLLGAVAQNPKNLGVGIDENTAILVEHERNFRVVGSGAVYVLDGTRISYSNLSEENPEGVLSIFGATLHVLGGEDRFDLAERRPMPRKGSVAEK